jgi:hypothetical protein
MKFFSLAIMIGALLVPSFLKADLANDGSQKTMFVSIFDNKQQRRVESLKELVKRHGGDIRADRFEKAEDGEKGFRYNCVLLVSDKVATALLENMGAALINEVSARVIFKSSKSLFSKTIDKVVFASPENGFESTFSWFKNDFANAPWEFLRKEYPSDFAEHCKDVDQDGREVLRIKNSKVTVQLFPKGSEPGADSIFYEWSNDTGDLFFGKDGGEQ